MGRRERERERARAREREREVNQDDGNRSTTAHIDVMYKSSIYTDVSASLTFVPGEFLHHFLILKVPQVKQVVF